MRRIVYSGMCICGHSYNQHHLMMCATQEAADAVGAPSVPGACLAYGCNEMEGLDKDGNPHCFQYVDVDDPNREELEEE